ncbi:Putative RxLR effector [Phytophthora palmivora]|uniref:RxLR effector protein n=1 Tax=Phytophthora palmivora TaxID=4796 RepID=A0A2P4Y7W1_9STRA|nr:Putative RxLR effector [Phytophthora palmivora]
MRVTFVVLTAMTAIITNAATKGEPTSISTTALAGEVHMIDTVMDDGEVKRLLRNNRVSEDGEEERLSRQSLNNLLDGNTAHKFALWKSKRYDATKIYRKLDVSTHSDRLWIYNDYVKYLKKVES